MSTVKLGTTTLVSDTPGSQNYGEFRFIGGDREEEIYERSFPGSSGVYEVFSGDRRRLIRVRCTWHTDNDQGLENFIDDIRARMRYETLYVTAGTSGTKSFPYCRLVEAAPIGEPMSGYLMGDEAYVMSKMLTFKQVRFGN